MFPREIDLIAWDNKTLVFIEVRSGRKLNMGCLLKLLTIINRERLDKWLNILVNNKLADVYCRFDVVGIVWGKEGKEPQIEVLKDAF